MISFFVERYPGDVQTRGLWLWSGGDEKDVPYFEAPEKRWDQLWALAEKEETRNAPQNLIQEALLDAPGDKFLIDCLVSFSKTTNEPIKNDAKFLVEILEHWGEKLEFDGILASLLIFSNCSVRDGLTVLIPILNEKIDEGLRDKWDSWLQKIKKERQTGSVKGIYSLLDFTLGSLMENIPKIESQKFQTIAPIAKAHLEKVLKKLEDLPDNDQNQVFKIDMEESVEVRISDQVLLDSLIKEFMPFIGTFGEIDPKTLKPISLTSFNAIQKIFEISKTISIEHEWPWLNDSAEIWFKSIWATKHKKTEDETAKNS